MTIRDLSLTEVKTVSGGSDGSNFPSPSPGGGTDWTGPPISRGDVLDEPNPHPGVGPGPSGGNGSSTGGGVSGDRWGVNLNHSSGSKTEKDKFEEHIDACQSCHEIE